MDTRVFRIAYASGTVRYGNRITASGAASWSAFSRGAHRKGKVTRIDATNAGATDGWTDVTAELIPGTTSAGKNEP